MSQKSKAMREEIQRKRDEAYAGGWDDGYAEGFGKARAEAEAEYRTTHLPPEEIDKLRFAAFATNKPADLDAYYRAASLYFQERHERDMNREAEKRLYVAAALREAADTASEWWDDPQMRDAILALIPDAGSALDRALRDALAENLAMAVEALCWYHDQSCEGFCKDLRYDSTYNPEMDDECFGCKARATLATINGDKTDG